MRTLIILLLSATSASAQFSMVSTVNWSLVDGSANAPAGVAPQLPNILNGLHRPPWKVAGVDYGVGFPAGQSFTGHVIGTDSFAANCPNGSLASNVVTVSGSGTCTFNGWDFTQGGGKGISLDNSFTGTLNISNSKFSVGTNNVAPLGSVGVPLPTAVNVSYTTFLGNSGGGTQPGMLSVNSGNVSITYVYVKNWDNDVFRSNGAPGLNLTYKYNVVDSGNFGSTCANNQFEHPDQLHAAFGANSIVWQFNTSYQPAGDPVFGLPGGLGSFLRASDATPGLGYNNVEAGWNVWTGAGATGHQGCFNTATGTTATSGSPADVNNIDTTATGLGNTLPTIDGDGVYGTGIPTPGSTVTVASHVLGVSGSLTLSQRPSSNGTNPISIWNQNPAIGQIIRLNGVAGISLGITTPTSWTSGQVTFTTASAHGLASLSLISVTGVNPPAYNGVYATTFGTTGSTIVAPLAGNPGAYVSGGTVTSDGTMHSLVSHDNYFNYGGPTASPTITFGMYQQCSSGCAPGIIQSQATINNVNMFDGTSIP